MNRAVRNLAAPVVPCRRAQVRATERGKCAVATGLFGYALLFGTLAHGAPFAYVPNTLSNNLSVIDVATSGVVATVLAGEIPLGVAVNPAGTRAYISSYVGNSVAVLDTTTNTVIGTIAVGERPQGLAVNPAGTRLYVANQTLSSLTGTVSVVDTASNTVVNTVTVGRSPHEVAVNPAGTRVYVSNRDSSTVAVIDASTNTVVATIGVGLFPRGLAVNPAGTRLYVANSGGIFNSTVSVIDTQNNAVLATPRVGEAAYNLAITPDGKRVFVTNTGSRTISVIDTQCDREVATISTGATGSDVPVGIAINRIGTLVYATLGPASRVLVIDAESLAVTGSIAVGNSPQASPAFGPGGPPAPPPPPPVIVTGMEVTQGIQDVANSVQLNNSRRTFVRVYVRAVGAPVVGATASLSAIGNFESGGGTTAVPLGSIVPSNPGGPRITIPIAPQRANLNDSFLFELPFRWTQFSALRLAASISGAAGAPSPSCTSDPLIAPVRELRRFTTLKVQFVRMAYQLPGVYPPPGNGFAQASSIEQQRNASWINRAYPLSRLISAPSMVLFDPVLGTYVDQSSPICMLYPAARREMCAHDYTAARLAALQIATGFMGDADVGYALIPQYPGVPGTRGACCTARIGAGPANVDDYAAHEVGHFLGRDHPVQGSGLPLCRHSADDPNYPHFRSRIAPQPADPNTDLAGFDRGEPSLGIDMGFRSPGGHSDIMGYCKPSWISDYTYNALAIALQILNPFTGTVDAVEERAHRRAPAGPSQGGDFLIVQGSISGDRTFAALNAIQRVDRVFEQPPRPPGDYSIRLVDAGGATLADYSFAPVIADDSVGSAIGALPQLSFGHAVPFVAGTRAVRIVTTANGSVIGTTALSATAPSVANVALQGAPDPTTGIAMLAWTASDADGDPLRFDLFSTRDNGATLRPLKLGVTGASTTIDTSMLAGGSTRFRVIGYDGVLTAWADSAATTLVNRPPQARILTPADRVRVFSSQVVNLEGEASDALDGFVADNGLTWSTPQGPLGTGAQLTVTTLPVGITPVTLTATNSVGLVATQVVNVIVDGNLGTPGPTLTVGPNRIGWHVANGETQLQTAQIHLGNRGSGSLQFTASSGAAWLSVDTSTGGVPVTLTLTANPAGFPDDSIQQTTLTLNAVGVAGQSLVIPVQVGVGNTFVAAPPPPAAADPVFSNGFEPVAPTALR